MDELRKGIEALPAEAYKNLSYCTRCAYPDPCNPTYCTKPYTLNVNVDEKWSRSAASALMERGILTLAEIEAALGQGEEADPPVK